MSVDLKSVINLPERVSLLGMLILLGLFSCSVAAQESLSCFDSSYTGACSGLTVSQDPSSDVRKTFILLNSGGFHCLNDRLFNDHNNTLSNLVRAQNAVQTLTQASGDTVDDERYVFATAFLYSASDFGFSHFKVDACDECITIA